MATLGALTYSQLVTAVSDYTQNTFDTTDMNTMIQQAEQRIYNSVQLANLRKTSTTALTPSVNTFNAPTDLLSVYSFAVIDASGNYIYLLNKDPAFMQEAYPNPATTGTPKFYMPESIVTATTTWLSENFSSVLLYGTLVEANTYMKGEQDMTAMYNQKYMEALALLKNLGEGKQQTDTYRREPRIPVS